MTRYHTSIAILFSFLLTCTGLAQLLPNRANGGWKAHSIPVGNLFNRSNMLDMEADANGVIWILGSNSLFYLVNEGVFKFDAPVVNNGSNLLFLSEPDNDKLRFISRFGITEIDGIHSNLKQIDLRAKLKLDDERFIRHAQLDTDQSVLLLVGDDDTRELWRIDSTFEKTELLNDDLQRPDWIQVLDDRIILSGKGIHVLYPSPDGTYRAERPSMNHLSVSAKNSLASICHDEQYVYLRSGLKRLFVYDRVTGSVEEHAHTQRIEYCWIDDQGELIILDEENRLLDKQSNVLLDIAAESNIQAEASMVQSTSGSRGFTIGSNLWITSPNGLTQINRRKSDFSYTAIGERVDRVTNVIEDSIMDRAFVLSARRGLFIYRLSDGALIKHIELDQMGRQIQGFKWEMMDDQLYVYCLNGIYRFDRQKEELTLLVDPLLLNEVVLANRLNTMACVPRLNQLIAGTKDNNLIRYDVENEKTVLLTISKDSEGRNLVYEVDTLPDGNILALTERGFYYLDLSDNTIVPASNFYPNIPKESNPALSGFQVMTDSSMLVSTFGKGLFVYDFLNDTTYRPVGDAFQSADVSDIFFDGLAHVYGSSKLGLLSYHIPSNSLRLTTIDEGVLSQNIYYRYMYSETPGEMTIGLLNAYVSFKSSHIAEGSKGKMIVNAFQVNGRPYNSLQDGLTNIALDYTQNNIQITPGSTINGKMNSIIYQARLIGLHDDWRTLSMGGIARYDALAPGSYRWEIIDINSDDKPLSIDINISAPFWRKAWFIALVLLTISAIVLSIVRLRVEFLRKETKLKSEHQLEVARLEMKSLRAQMNPHFLFNSLNSIKSFIAQNEPRIATRYLTKFSHLIRLILNNSREALVSLEQELKALELYIELEQLRFEHSFEYRIDIAPQLSQDSIMLPPLILQPYVENAIWHGLLHKDGQRQLEIDIEAAPDGILVIIRDNGIGREAARAIKSKTATKHKSLGMAITADRIGKVQDGVSSQGVSIHDLTAPDGESMGTEVRIHIPHQSNRL